MAPEPFGTVIWFFQFAFTSASAVYQFAVLGVRHYLPFGLILLIAASILSMPQPLRLSRRSLIKPHQLPAAEKESR